MMGNENEVTLELLTGQVVQVPVERIAEVRLAPPSPWRAQVRFVETTSWQNLNMPVGVVNARIADATPAPEPKTVTLHDPYTHAKRVFYSIISIKSGHTGRIVMGRCVYGETRKPDDGTLVCQTVAEITELARDAWGADWDCEGAVPRLEPTVTLHGASGQGYEYRSIENIDGNVTPDIIGSWRYPGGAWNDRSGPQPVTESAAEVTRLARDPDAFGPTWDCEGAEPPVVVLRRDMDSWTFSKITHLSPDGRGCAVVGNRPSCENREGRMRTDCACEEVRADCAAAGVPCPEEEPEKPDRGPWHQGRCVACGVEDGEVGKLQAQVANLTGRSTNTEARVAKLKQQITQLGADVWQERRESVLLRERVAELEQQNAAQVRTIKNLQNEVNAASDENAKRVAKLETESRVRAEEESADWIRMRNQRDGLDVRVRELRQERNEARETRAALQAQLDARADWRETEECPRCYGKGSGFFHTVAPGVVAQCPYCLGTGLVVKPARDKPEPEIVLHHQSDGSEWHIRISELLNYRWLYGRGGTLVSVKCGCHGIVEEMLGKIAALIADAKGDCDE